MNPTLGEVVLWQKIQDLESQKAALLSTVADLQEVVRHLCLEHGSQATWTMLRLVERQEAATSESVRRLP